MKEEFEVHKKQIDNSIRKILFIQSVPCIRTIKVAKALSVKGVVVDLIYFALHPTQVYKDIDLPFKNIYQLKNITQLIDHINNSDYDVLYSSNEPDYLTVLFSTTNKPIIHDTHDMMSLRSDLTIEQVVFEYLANVKSTGNIYVNPLIRDIAVARFNLKDKPILNLHSFIEQEQLPDKIYEKSSKKDGDLHCVFEGGLLGTPGHHRYLEPIFLMLAQNHIHVHLHCQVNPDYIKELVDKSSYIHYEGLTSPKNLITEMTKYDVGLAIFNMTEKNKTFLDTAFPNKIWDYLAAGLPILFSDLLSFRAFAAQSKVGKVLNLNEDIRKQVEEISRIKIDQDILKKKKWLMNDVVQDIISFMEAVKSTYYNSQNIASNEKINLLESKLYDDIYKNGGYGGAYFKHYSETLYIDIWYKAASIIKRISNPMIIDIGCGPGQFANLLFDFGIINYKGIDYSAEAIKLAKLRNDKYNERFYLDNAYTSNIYEEEYNIVTLFEVLEHVEEDITLLNKIKKDSIVLFSVPNYLSRGHVRCFHSKEEIYERYKQTVEINEIYESQLNEVNKLYLAVSVKL
ncbi:MAG: hypothetical protein CVV02_10065 [Firmicutes bacterium HGW-Firmicutes-7]|nr:MAG: hypothetical protein CVV02_10065 [Firmicutes bacterium HGW-Firmicutes-7]